MSLTYLRKILVAICLYFLVTLTWAQKSEIGIRLNEISYSGELNYQNLLPTELSIGGTIFYRHIISQVISLRTSLNMGILDVKNLNQELINSSQLSDDKFSFRKTIIGTNIVAEYHFLDYRQESKYSPYITSGLGAGLIGNNISIYIPLGLGMKILVSRNVSIEIEALSNKTFTDNIDIVDYNNGSPNYSGANPNYDSFTYWGIGISYQFIPLKCPPYMKGMF